MKQVHMKYEKVGCKFEFSSEVTGSCGKWAATVYMKVDTPASNGSNVIPVEHEGDFESESQAKIAAQMIVNKLIDNDFNRVG